MVNMKRIVSIILAIAMFASLMISVPISASAYDYITEGAWTYSLIDGSNIQIEYYSGGRSYVTVPSKISGYTVRSIGESAFEDQDDIQYVTIPDTVNTIGKDAFYDCDGLRSVKFSNSLTAIEDYAFCNCVNLESLSFPASLKYIRLKAFASCWKLSSITIPANVVYIDDYAFATCTGVRTITVLNPRVHIGTMALGFHSDDGGETYAADNTMTIKGFRNSTTYDYVMLNELKFQAINSSVKINSGSSCSLYVKGTKQLSVSVTNQYGSIAYSSSNPTVASVSGSGKIVAKKAGTATITVSNNGGRATFKVVVKNPSLNKKSKTIKVGKSFTIKVKGKIGKATFKSSKKKVATVNSSGKVVAKKKGNAVITVKANGVTLKCKIKVKK